MSKKKINTEIGVVKNLREIRDKMNLDMQDMTFEEMKAYLAEMRKGRSYNHLTQQDFQAEAH